MAASEGALPAFTGTSSQLPPSAVVIVAVQLSVPDPAFSIWMVWLGGAPAGSWKSWLGPPCSRRRRCSPLPSRSPARS